MKNRSGQSPASQDGVHEVGRSARESGHAVNVRKRKPAPSDAGVASSRAVSEAPPPPPTGDSRAMRIMRGVLGFVMVVTIGGGVAYGARRYVKTSTRFQVAEIVTHGAKRRSAEELAVTAGVAKGQNVFGVDLERARTRLLADPWVAEASLARQLPGTIFVQVKEREAAGIVATTDAKNDAGKVTGAGETYLVTREGTIIKRLEPGDPSDLQVITGISLQHLVEDREGTTRTIRRALDLAFDYDRTPLAHKATLQEVHVESNGEMTLVIGKTSVMVHMGASPYRRKLEQTARVMAELDRRGAKPDAIMLDNEARPDRVVVRMR